MMKGAIISATGLNGSAALPFVIPSEAEGSAVQPTTRGNVFSTLPEENKAIEMTT
jgi:hypothetical protein